MRAGATGEGRSPSGVNSKVGVMLHNMIILAYGSMNKYQNAINAQIVDSKCASYKLFFL